MGDWRERESEAARATQQEARSFSLLILHLPVLPDPKMKCPLWSLPGPWVLVHLAGATGLGRETPSP